MFIIIIGTRASGKSAVKEYLVRYKDFRNVRLLDAAKAAESHESTSHYNDKLGKTDIDSSAADSLRYSSDTETLDGQQITIPHEIIDSEVVLNTPASFLSMTSSLTNTSLESGSRKDTDDNLAFSSPALLLEHITRHWRENFVTEDISTRTVLEPFLKRPSVLLVSVDAPILDRYRRFSGKNRTIKLEEFVEEDDRISYGPNSDSITSAYLFLHVHLDFINLLNPDRLRPSWDSYFMKLASLASHRSNCMKRRVGAILTRDYTIIATGYNGTPRGVPNCTEGGCKRCNEGGASAIEGFEECLCIHAEENALLEAGRERVGKGAVLYCNTCPCLKCSIKIVQNGVSEVVYNLSYKMDTSSARVFRTAGVKFRQYSPPQ